MFKFKNNKPIGADNFFLDLQYNILMAQVDIGIAVEDVIIMNGCVNLYPSGADKDKAIKDAEKAKERLLGAIGAYDSWLVDYKNKLTIYPEEERAVTKDWNEYRFENSHKLVEKYYKEFYKKT